MKRNIIGLLVVSLVMAHAKSLYGEPGYTQTGPVIAATATEMANVGMGCIDAPFPNLSRGDGTSRTWFHTFDWGKQTQRFRGTPDRPCGTLEWNKSREQLFTNPSSIDGKAWLMSLYSCSDGILAFLHVEFAAPGNKGRVALAWSTDGANTFTWLGNIVAPYLDKDLTGGFIIGVPYLVVGSYFYIYENDNNGIACARALVSDVIAAAKNGTVTTWKKYYNGEWNEDGLGGNSSVLPGLDNWGITHVQAIHSTITGKYYLPLTRMTWSTDTWIKLYESDDAINWSLLSTLTNQPASEVGVNNGWQYATLVSTDANAENSTCESSFYLYCGYHPYDSDKTLYRWTITPGGFPPLVNNAAGATNIRMTSAYLNGNVTSTGASPTYVWAYWGDNDGGTNQGGWDRTNYFGQCGLGLVTTNVTGLTPATTYYYRFCATNTAGTMWASSSSSFMTGDGRPVVENLAATGITATAVWMNGNVVSTGSAPTDVWVYWGPTDGGTNKSSWTNAINLGLKNEGTVSQNTTNLSSNTVYYYSFYATNTVGGVWAGGAATVTTSGGGSVSAVGGTVTNYTLGGTNWIAHIFTTVGTNNLSVTAAGNIEVLVVAGGGGGGANGGGGGGGGGVIYSNIYRVVAGSNYAVSVGAGGPSHPNGVTNPTNGGNSAFGLLVALGGGGGASRDNGGGPAVGGSGGGGSASWGNNARASGTNGITGQGNRGGNGIPQAYPAGSGGGGGAGAAGANAPVGNAAGNGGTGTNFPTLAHLNHGQPAGWFGGGGGGGVCGTSGLINGLGGTGGGGNGGGVAGTANTGGGGGGGQGGEAGAGAGGQSGGSGIVIVRYVSGNKPSILTSAAAVSVPEGGTNTFQVRLSSQPTGSVTVAVAVTAGDTDITVTGGTSLTFTTNNWATYQTVTLAAAEDADAENGTATVTGAGAELLGATVTAVESENEATLTVNAGAGGSTTPSGATVVSQGAATGISAAALAGCSFTNWSVTSGAATFANSNLANTTVSIAGNATVQANFSVVTGTAAPVDLPVTNGLTVWLDSTDLNGDGVGNNPAAGTLVAQWNNKAGSFHATQGSDTYKPKMFRDATTGKDVVRFQRPASNTARYLAFNHTSIATLMGTTNTIFAVARANMGSGDTVQNWCATVLGRKGWNYPLIFFSGYPFANGVGSFWRGSNDGNPGNGRDTSTGLGQNHDTLVVISATVWGQINTAPMILQIWKRDWNGTTASAPVTNATYGLWSGAGSGGDANMLFVGSADASSGNYTQGLEGDIGEILIYNRALSEAERAQVEDYLAGRWVTDYSALLPVTLNAGAGRVRDGLVDSATNYTHTFITPGQYSFVVNKRIQAEYFLVAGGGGGGSARWSGSGGGGGGGVLTNGPGNKLTLAAGTYTITVGNGGGGGTNSGGLGMNGFNGGNSSITNAGGSVSVIAKGGGGGGGDYNNDGSSGASGGGAAYFSVPGTNNAPGQGKDGGKGYPPSWYAGINDQESAGGGGGGYGGVGQAATLSKGGDGGTGVTNTLTGYALSYAGGGGGGKRSSGAVGYGKDGGGNGVKDAPTAGAANTGGGGGGNGTGGGTPVNGAAGGSGIVIIKYALPGPPQGMVIYFR